MRIPYLSIALTVVVGVALAFAVGWILGTCCYWVIDAVVELIQDLVNGLPRG